MALNCIGTTPNDSAEYECESCKHVFEYKAQDADGEPTYEEPKYCPSCGKQ